MTPTRQVIDDMATAMLAMRIGNTVLGMSRLTNVTDDGDYEHGFQDGWNQCLNSIVETTKENQ